MGVGWRRRCLSLSRFNDPGRSNPFHPVNPIPFPDRLDDLQDSHLGDVREIPRLRFATLGMTDGVVSLEMIRRKSVRGITIAPQGSYWLS